MNRTKKKKENVENLVKIMDRQNWLETETESATESTRIVVDTNSGRLECLMEMSEPQTGTSVGNTEDVEGFLFT